MKIIKFFEKIQNIGVDPHIPSDIVKKIKLTNSISIVTIVMGLIILGYAFLVNWPPIALFFLFLLNCSVYVTLFLNYFHKTLASRVYYLISAYVIILSLAIIFGQEVHYQYFLIGGIGMPFFLLENKIGNIRFFLSGLSIIFWGYLEWHFLTFPTFITLNSDYFFIIRLTNDFLVLVTVFSIIYLFITENDRHLEKIEKQALKLKEINDELEQFSYHVSHDLKAPLINIHSLIYLVKRKYSDDMNNELIKILSMIETSSKRSENLINSILSYAKVGQDELEISEFKINEVIQNVCTLIKIPEGFHVQYKDNLPSVIGSYIQMEQVLTNLIGNAIKYHDQNKGLIKIVIKNTENNRLKIVVKDDGPGIKTQYLKSIFNMFDSANQKNRVDSTGIGLAIVKKLVEKNGGKVGVDSTVGEGSSFWFTWPLNHHF